MILITSPESRVLQIPLASLCPHCCTFITSTVESHKVEEVGILPMSKKMLFSLLSERAVVQNVNSLLVKIIGKSLQAILVHIFPPQLEKLNWINSKCTHTFKPYSYSLKFDLSQYFSNNIQLIIKMKQFCHCQLSTSSPL